MERVPLLPLLPLPTETTRFLTKCDENSRTKREQRVDYQNNLPFVQKLLAAEPAETASVLTHAVAGAVFFVHFCVLYVLFEIRQSPRFASAWSLAATAAAVATFFVSTTFHWHGMGRLAAVLRNLDHLSISVTVLFFNVADLAVFGDEFAAVPTRAIVDPVLATVITCIFFLTRRLTLTTEETLTETRSYKWTVSSVSVKVQKQEHSDKIHSALRGTGYVITASAWLLVVPLARHSSGATAFQTWIILTIAGYATLAVGAVVLFGSNDGVERLITRMDYSRDSWLHKLCCVNRCGISHCTDHAWWHIISATGLLAVTLARDYALLFK